MPVRNYNASYRYGFNGKEMDNDAYGQGNEYDYGFRIYNPREGRFLSVDPLTGKFPFYTPYQFAGNKPIAAIDLDGQEDVLFHWIFPPAHPKTPAAIISTDVAYKVQRFENSRTGMFIRGGINTVTGIVGAIGSASYIGVSDGTSAILGGAVALQFSLAQASIGVAQMADAFSNNPNKALQSSSNIPGLISYSMNSTSAPYIDAITGLVPSITMSGGGESFLNLSGFARDAFGVISTAKNLYNSPSIRTAIEFLDQLHTVKGVTVEAFKLASNGADGAHLKQKLEYVFSYNVQKGDDLTSIAKKFNTTIDAIQQENNIKDPNNIQTGQKLKFHNVVYGGGSSNRAGANGDN